MHTIDDSILVNWDSKVGSHSCTFTIDWLKEHDYTTPHIHTERMKQQEPLCTVRTNIINDNTSASTINCRGLFQKSITMKWCHHLRVTISKAIIGIYSSMLSLTQMDEADQLFWNEPNAECTNSRQGTGESKQNWFSQWPLLFKWQVTDKITTPQVQAYEDDVRCNYFSL